LPYKLIDEVLEKYEEWFEGKEEKFENVRLFFKKLKLNVVAESEFKRFRQNQLLYFRFLMFLCKFCISVLRLLSIGFLRISTVFFPIIANMYRT